VPEVARRQARWVGGVHIVRDGGAAVPEAGADRRDRRRCRRRRSVVSVGHEAVAGGYRPSPAQAARWLLGKSRR